MYSHCIFKNFYMSWCLLSKKFLITEPMRGKSTRKMRYSPTFLIKTHRFVFSFLHVLGCDRLALKINHSENSPPVLVWYYAFVHHKRIFPCTTPRFLSPCPRIFHSLWFPLKANWKTGSVIWTTQALPIRILCPCACGCLCVCLWVHVDTIIPVSLVATKSSHMLVTTVVM